MKIDPQQSIWDGLRETGNEPVLTKCDGNVFPFVQSKLEVSFDFKGTTSVNVRS